MKKATFVPEEQPIQDINIIAHHSNLVLKKKEKQAPANVLKEESFTNAMSEIIQRYIYLISFINGNDLGISFLNWQS